MFGGIPALISQSVGDGEELREIASPLKKRNCVIRN